LTSRCPKCGRNNYGDGKKCSFCGAPLTFIPGEEVPEVSEEDIQEKMSKMKVERIRNPTLYFVGGIIGIVGIVLMIVLYLLMMFLVYSSGGVDVEYEQGSFVYNVNGGEQMIFGEITRVTTYEDTEWGEGGNHGYQEYTAYEIDGDGSDRRVEALREGNVDYEADVWVYSDEDLGSSGDRVLIRVESKSNNFGEDRAISPGYAPWGGKGFRSGWIWLMPGLLIFLGGLAVFLIGIIGKADRSMERLLQEDKELRQQQLMLRQAAKKQMQEKERQKQWQEGGGPPPQQAGGEQPPPPQRQPAPPVAQQVGGGQPRQPPQGQPQQPTQQGQPQQAAYAPPQQPPQGQPQQQTQQPPKYQPPQ
jgi:predicted nucleic acid-binding Zn ribbon protein